MPEAAAATGANATMIFVPPPAEFGDTKCCTDVVAWAEDDEDFTATVSTIFERRHWSILRVQ
jgi:hypothetical protein